MKNKMKDILLKIKKMSKKKKVIFASIIFIIIFFIIYFSFFKNSKAISTYTTEIASKQTIVSSLSETGQVSVDGSITLKSSVSGKITSIKVKSGDIVKQGQLVASIDTSNISKTLRQAKLSYDNAKINYEKAVAPGEESDIFTANNNLASAEADLLKSYSNTVNDISNSYSSIFSTLSSLNDLIYSSSINPNQNDIYYYSDNTRAIENNYTLQNQSTSYFTNITSSYRKAKSESDAVSSYVKNINSASSENDILSALDKIESLGKSTNDAVRNYINFIQYYQNLYSKYDLSIESKTNTQLTNLKSYLNNINSTISTVTSDKNNISDLKSSIAEAKTKLQDLQSGATGLDLEAAKISLEQSRLNYESALESYSDYFITAPIAGTIGSVSAIVGQDASGVNIATVVTDSKFANLSVSESDISKIKLGQKATLTFDAVEALSMVGTVSEINPVGAVSSGVVSYTVKIAFDDDEDQVKSGMSVTANIIVDTATDVVAVPSSALKSNTFGNYILVFESTSTLISYQNSNSVFTSSVEPIKKTVVIGLVGDDYTEIVEGLSEGDIIVTKTTSSSKTTSVKTATSPKTNISSRSGSVAGPGMMEIMR